MNIFVVVVAVGVALLLFALYNDGARVVLGLGHPRRGYYATGSASLPGPPEGERPPLAAADSTVPSPTDSHAPPVGFTPSPGWAGRKPGYVFRTGDLGVGYYEDRKVDFSTEEVLEFDSGESPESVRGRRRSLSPLELN